MSGDPRIFNPDGSNTHRMGKAKGYEGLFTTNCNKLTQHIAKLLQYQVSYCKYEYLMLTSVSRNLRNHENTLRKLLTFKRLPKAGMFYMKEPVIVIS
jgi:hypothetical protein